MSKFILEASALIAMLKAKPGGSKVADEIGDARMGVFNYAEVISHLIHAGMPERAVNTMPDSLPMHIVSADMALVQYAGRMRAVTAKTGLSLSDGFCLALAKREGLTAWTADTAWTAIADVTAVKIFSIR